MSAKDHSVTITTTDGPIARLALAEEAAIREKMLQSLGEVIFGKETHDETTQET